MLKNILYFFILFFSFSFFSCEEEIGSINLTTKSVGKLTLNLKKDREIDIWTEMDIEYRKKPLFVYDFEFYNDSTRILKGGTDPLVFTHAKINNLSTKAGITHWHFYGKIEGNFIPKKDGIYTIKTTFVNNNYPDLKINKAKIIFVK